jgi:hypothetical protein
MTSITIPALTSKTSRAPGPANPIGADLARTLRTLKLSGLKDTLPGRLALARRQQRPHPGTRRRRQNPPRDRPRPHGHPPPSRRDLLPRRQTLHPASSRLPREHARCRDTAPDHDRRAHHRRLRVASAGLQPDQRLLRTRRRTTPQEEHHLGP